MALRIVGALGLTAAALSMGACGGNVVVDHNNGAGGDAGSGGSGGGGSGGGGSGGGGSGGVCQLPDGYVDELHCLPIPTNPAPCPDAQNAYQTIYDDLQGGPDCAGSGTCCDIQELCGPDIAVFEQTGECCYHTAVNYYGCEGRPFMAEGEARVAAALERADWLTSVGPAGAALDARSREVLAGRFREAALYEHASVASFARFALELLGLGAPADLVALAHEAMGDEIRHARLCFSLASRFAGEAIGPGALDLSGGLEGARTAAEVAASVAFEGCINETISALIAAAERDRAADPSTRAALESIAADEAAHAELAWRSLSWLLSIGGEGALRQVRRVFDEPPAYAAREERIDGADRAALAAHGWLPVEERRRIAERSMREVILPCGRALLASVAPRRHEGAALTA